ncbi:hypothetical protein [Taibaiella koreensis]|uniref:hypothetical protein n=1 Tax=Taibaiella koreensis TaxID=1268548 RepID=UPI000E5993F8|nr:hypothetical protein [Taibaiella koreensis]
MLQNRVTPFGEIIKTAARGSWMGNRGQLHKDDQQIVRPFKLKAWLTCLLAFNGRQRQVMAPHRYTELFFRDEATAFASGHRPCFECRRQDYQRFKALWLKGNPGYGFMDNVSIQKIDEILHRERIDPNGKKIVYEDVLDTLPDGCFIAIDQDAYVLYQGVLHLWTPEGYTKNIILPPGKTVTVLTPRSIVNTFIAGYLPEVGPFI